MRVGMIGFGWMVRGGDRYRRGGEGRRRSEEEEEQAGMHGGMGMATARDRRQRRRGGGGAERGARAPRPHAPPPCSLLLHLSFFLGGW
jgi:hypothetical protein